MRRTTPVRLHAPAPHARAPSALSALLVLIAACGRAAPARVDSAAPRPASEATTPASPTSAAAAGPATCADTSEARALDCARGRARRAGDTLVLDVAGGRAPVRLADNLADGEQYARYRFAGTALGGRYYVIDGTGYEWIWTELVDAESGQRASLTGRPVPSPDGAHLAAAARDLGIAEGATRLEIWRVQPGKPALELQLQPFDQVDTANGWGPGDPTWRGPDTLVVPRFFPDHTRPDGEVAGDTALVVFDGKAWSLVARDRPPR